MVCFVMVMQSAPLSLAVGVEPVERRQRCHARTGALHVRVVNNDVTKGFCRVQDLPITDTAARIGRSSSSKQVDHCVTQTATWV
jgi:hypothetical protein